MSAFGAEQLTDTEIGQFRALMEERKDAARPIEGPLTSDETASVKGLLNRFEGVEFGGFIENFFQYESVHPGGRDSSAIPPKVFDRQVDSFTVNNIEMWLYKEASNPGDIGFKFTLNWGDTARRITFVPPVMDDASTLTGGRQTTFSEGYVLYNVPVGKGVTLKFGKIDTWVGYEVWEAQWNPNFSRSYIYGWLIPFTNTGVGVSYPVFDSFTADYYFVNSSDGFVNNNKSFTHGLQLDYNPPDIAFFKDTNIHLDTLWGAEGASNNSDWTSRYDLTVSFAPLNKISLATNANVSTYDGSRNKGAANPNMSAWGIAQYFVYQHSDDIGFALRGEYFWDKDNMAGISGTNLGATLGEIPATLNLKIRERMYFRPEVRYDKIISVRRRNLAGPDPSHVWNRNSNNNVTGSIAATYEF
ncbi:MAG: outer membrane beta-barrel protein [Candidatus Brocadiales bacterium]